MILITTLYRIIFQETASKHGDHFHSSVASGLRFAKIMPLMAAYITLQQTERGCFIRAIHGVIIALMLTVNFGRAL